MSSSNQDDGNEIRSIKSKDLALLTSGQVLLDLQGAVKELVENALDAGATNLEIKFKDHGAESFEVIDNGHGIDPKNYEGLALKHHTSKLSSFSDLSSVSTFGFRGEALSSLCALSSVSILTSTSLQSPIGTILSYSSSGQLLTSSQKSARSRGTTITVKDLFKTLPVRRREFEKNLKKEFGKCLNLLQSYVLISKGVKWNVNNILTKQGNKKVGNLNVNSSKVKDDGDWLNQNVVNVFGTKVNQGLLSFELELRIEEKKSVNQRIKDGLKKKKQQNEDSDEEIEDPNPEGFSSEPPPPIKVTGLISSPTSATSRSSSDRQFIYLNGRPWDSNKLLKVFNEVFRSHNNSNSGGNSFPFLIADFKLRGDSYDVNVSPDKRTLMVHDENLLVDALKTSLEEFFAPTRSTFQVSGASSKTSNSKTLSSTTQTNARANSIRTLEDSTLTQSKLNFESLGKGKGRAVEDEDEHVEEQEDNDPIRREENDFDNDEEEVSEQNEGVGLIQEDFDEVEELHPSDFDFKGKSKAKISSQTTSTSRNGQPRDHFNTSESNPTSSSPPSSDSFHSVRESSPALQQSRKANSSNIDRDETSERASKERQTFDETQDVQDDEIDQDAVIDTTQASWSPLKKNRPGAYQNSAFKTPAQKVPMVNSNSNSSSRTAQVLPQKVVRGKPHPDLAGLLQLFGRGNSQSREERDGYGSSKKRAKVGNGGGNHYYLDEEDEEREEQRNRKTEREKEEIEERSKVGREEESDEEVEIEVEPEDLQQEVIEIEDDQESEDQDSHLQESKEELRSSRLEMEVDEGHGEGCCSHDQENEATRREEEEDPIARDEREHNLAALDEIPDDSSRGQKPSTREEQFPSSTWRNEFSNLAFNSDPDSKDRDSNIPTIAFDLASITERIKRRNARLEREERIQLQLEEDRREEKSRLEEEYEETLNAGLHVTESSVAESALTRIIKKEDFLTMKVVGQFNLGFIIARRRVRVSDKGRNKSAQDDQDLEMEEEETGNGEVGEWLDDLFIVDQHAADEKYNFETLQKETKIRSQRMICPKTLELSATDTLVVAEHLDALKDSGFELAIDEDAEVSKRVKLLSLPVSKDVVFGVRDLEELIHHLREVPSNSFKASQIRCSKARSMFASRACRKSVMIGKALNVRQMSNIMKHMSGMDQPWNCPHGRPTMRHLVSLSTTTIGSSSAVRGCARRELNWDMIKEGLEIEE